MHDEEESLYADRPADQPAVMRGPRVVVAVDGSAGSRAARRFALEDAARRGVPVEAVIAYRLPESRGDVSGIRPAEEARLRDTLRSGCEAKVRALLEEAARGLAGPRPDVQIRAALGSAACPVTVVHSAEAHRHRLRLHRERRDQRPDDRPEERRGGVEYPSGPAPLR